MDVKRLQSKVGDFLLAVLSFPFNLIHWIIGFAAHRVDRKQVINEEEDRESYEAWLNEYQDMSPEERLSKNMIAWNGVRRTKR